MPRGAFDRSARKARTRSALLDAAARVYAHHGIDGATLDQVAEEAGYTKGAVYAHFGSKDNLLLALVEEYVAQEVAEQVALFDRSEQTWRRPLAGSDTFMAELEQRPDLFRLLIELWVAAQRDERLRDRYVAGLTAMRAMFEDFSRESARDAGMPDDGPVPARLADVALGLSLGLGIVKVIEPRRLSPKLLGRALAVFIRALEGDPDLRRMLADLDAPLD
jgi:AcrR family transcriptional regulator